MKKRYILLVPVGGLANRMKAIDSAIKLSRKTNSELHIIWFKDRGLNCRFDQLFEPIDLPNVKITEATWSDYTGHRTKCIWVEIEKKRKGL